jgi:hypothetical protein
VWRGRGIFELRPSIGSQIASFSAFSEAATASSKFQASDPRVIGAFCPWTGASGSPEPDHLQLNHPDGRRFGLSANSFHMRLAQASVMLIGGRPRMSSIVASIEEVS